MSDAPEIVRRIEEGCAALAARGQKPVYCVINVRDYHELCADVLRFYEGDLDETAGRLQEIGVPVARLAQLRADVRARWDQSARTVVRWNTIYGDVTFVVVEADLFEVAPRAADRQLVG